MSRQEVVKKFRDFEKETETRVKYGIELYRKGNFRIAVVDENGNPIKNAKIKLTQKGHEFKYGANLFMLDELETPEKNELYRKYFSETFNMATLPFYWNSVEPEKGQLRYEKDCPKMYRRPAIDLCMEFCEEHGIEPREHGLAYDLTFPDWVKEVPAREVKKELSRRMQEISERYADRIPTIEVTNEIFWAWWVWGYSNTSALSYEEGVVEWCYTEARKWFPHNQLVINEGPWTMREDSRENNGYYMQVKQAREKGVPIDALGVQFHMFFPKEQEKEKTWLYYNPRYLWDILDRYGKLDIPLQITEVTIPAYTEESEDEEIQAEIIRNLYKIWFSHKNVEQIIYWNLVDGYAAFAEPGDFSGGENQFRGGLLRFDFTPKPAYYVIKDLFEKEWHTEEEATTDTSGFAYFRGFYGDYDVEIDGKTYRVRSFKDLPLDNDLNKCIKIKHMTGSKAYDLQGIPH